jgi:ectoine hydroxylase-related dioxygenase (phytanoyl-CoA dioxygenase family)
MRLTPEEVWLFRLNGYVRLPEPLPTSLVERLEAAIDADILAEREPLVRDGGRVVRLSKVLDRDPVFSEAATCAQVLEPLEDLLGPAIEMVHNVHNHANIRVGRTGPDVRDFHRDVPNWTRGLVTVLMYLEESTAERGCTQLVPGSHLLPWSDRSHPWSGGSATDDDGNRLARQVVRAESPAGGLLAIDSLLWHAPGPNKTGQTRTTITIGYHGADTLSTVDEPALTLVRGERTYTGHRPRAAPHKSP